MQRHLELMLVLVVLTCSSRVSAQSGDGAVDAEESVAESSGETDAPRGWHVTPGLQLFSQYAALLTDGAEGSTEWFHEFDVPRAWAWLEAGWGGARARVLLEGVRAGGRGSLFGVAGDSLVIRFREVWAGYRLFDLLEIRMGIVPELTAPLLTDAWGVRAVSRTGARQFEILHSADIGGTLTAELPRDLGALGVGIYNGESYENPELNRGKNTEFFAELHPLGFIPAVEPLTLLLSYQLGSTGTGLARTNRLTGGLMWLGDRIAAGSWVVWLQGYEDRGDLEGLLVEAFARGRVWRGLLVGARFSYFIRNLREQQDEGTEDWLMEITGTVGYRVLRPLAVYFAVDRTIAGDTASAALVGYERWALRVVIEFSLSASIEQSPGG
jgi:hypothetical protein